MNSKIYWKIRLGWARWRVRLASSRVWNLRRRLRMCRARIEVKQMELPFR